LKIVSFGCSLTFGTELPDTNQDGEFPIPSNLTWPALIAKKLGLSYQTRALGGSGNLSLLDRLLNHLYYAPDDIFIINWTFIDRFDYSDPNGSHFNNGHTDYLTLRPGGSDKTTDFYFRNLHSEFRDKFVNLIYLKSAIDILQTQKSRFLMTAIDDLLWCQRWHAPPHVIDLQNKIQPYISDFQGRNFLDWARHLGFEISSNGHPLQEAHQAAAEIMLPKVQLLLNNKNNLS
jgi:hypothetical protein